MCNGDSKNIDHHAESEQASMLSLMWWWGRVSYGMHVIQPPDKGAA